MPEYSHTYWHDTFLKKNTKYRKEEFAMHYYGDTLEEMSEGHKSAILQKNKSPSDGGHTHSYECVHEQKGPYVNLRVLWCKTCGTVIKYYIDGDGNQVILREFIVTKENEK